MGSAAPRVLKALRVWPRGLGEPGCDSGHPPTPWGRDYPPPACRMGEGPPRWRIPPPSRPGPRRPPRQTQGPNHGCWARTRRQGSPESPGSRWRRIARPRPRPRPGSGHLVLEPVDLAASGEGRGGGAPGGPAGPPPPPPRLFVSRRFFAGHSIARALQAGGGGGDCRAHGGGASRLLGPGIPRNRVRDLGRPPRPGPGAATARAQGRGVTLSAPARPLHSPGSRCFSAATELVSSPARTTPDHTRPDHAPAPPIYAPPPVPGGPASPEPSDFL